MKTFLTRLLLFAAVASSLPSLLVAQASSTTATVTGVVTDSSGAILPDTVVELSNPTTGLKFQTKTNSAGSYRFADIPPGPNYQVSFTHEGFSATTYRSIYVNLANVRTQNASLSAGSSVEIQVEASNTGATINTENATLGVNFQVKRLDDLPVQDRTTPSRLFTLQPGVTSGGSVTGARTDQNNVTVDGLDVNDFATGGFGSIVAGAPIDSVQEFRATVGGFNFDNGVGGGGQFALITRSGTNQFHGDLNGYHRDRTTVANSWFNNNSGVPRVQLIRNQFGGGLGGPIKRDKLLFFFDYNGSRIAQSVNRTRTVPLASYRAGNVSYINNGVGCTRASRQNTQANCISQLTPAQIQQADPAGIGVNTALLAFINSAYPVANDLTAGDGVNTGLFRFNGLSPDNRSQYAGKIDYYLTPKIHFFGTGNVSRVNSVQTVQQFPSSPVQTAPYVDRSYRWSAGMDWQISNSKLNKLTVGETVANYSFPVTYNPQGLTPITFATGTTTLFSDPYKTPVNAQGRTVPIWQVNDDFQWQIGRHSIDIGGNFKWIHTQSNTKLDYATGTIGLGGKISGLNASLRPTDILPASSTATVTYDSAFAAMLGRLSAVNGDFNYDAAGNPLNLGTGSLRQYKYYQLQAYIGDTWKVTPSLTIVYGASYQFFTVPYETKGLETVNTSTFNDYFGARAAAAAAGRTGNDAVPFQSYVLGGKANNGPDLYSPSLKDIAPHFGFAYNPSFDRNTVFRGSAALIYDRTVINAVQYQQDQFSYLFQQPIAISNGVSGNPRASLLNDPRFGQTITITAPATPKSGFQPYVANGVPYGLQNGSAFNTTIDPSLKTPYTINTTFGIEHSFQGNLVLRATYAGRYGRRLLAQADSNQLLDFADPASGQLMSEAVANLTLQARAGRTAANVTPQRWFENQVDPSLAAGYTSTTAAILDQFGSIPYNGDFADLIQGLSSYLAPNVGMGAQFASNNYYTNKGFSSYHSLMVTLQKNLTHGVQFDANYTWQHSMDNVSLIANTNGSGGYGNVCDVVRPRQCRSNSDFDVTHIFNANFTAQLPFGRGRSFASNIPWGLNELIGGWDVSGIPSWRSGQVFSTVGSAFVAGYANNAPAIFNGDTAAIRRRVHKTSSGSVSLFDDQTKAVGAFQGPIGFQLGSRNSLRGPTSFGFDAGLSKTFAVYKDSVNLKFRADAFNVLNHTVFATPSTNGSYDDITQPSTFGTLTSLDTDPRVLQLALRLEF